jgi:hypothetical protein
MGDIDPSLNPLRGRVGRAFTVAAEVRLLIFDFPDLDPELYG